MSYDVFQHKLQLCHYNEDIMSPIRTITIAATYRDSVFLMNLSNQAREHSGVEQISAMMGTPRNKDMLVRSGLFDNKINEAGPEDIVVSINASVDRLDHAEKIVRELLMNRSDHPFTTKSHESRPITIQQAKEINPDSNLAIISVAGDYAHYEAAQALSVGLDVMLYSDNISIEAELDLKRFSQIKDRLLMGPDCGTAIIDHVPLGFANRIRRGSIGIVGTSGTGLQEVSTLLDRVGLGISQVYGTGGRDVTDQICGITTLAALKRLAKDDETEAIVVIAKWPGPQTRVSLCNLYKEIKKPIIIRYLSIAKTTLEEEAGVKVANNLTELALLAAKTVAPILDTSEIKLPRAPSAVMIPPGNGYIRGIFSGGTLCYEAIKTARILGLRNLYSNLDIPEISLLNGYEPSRGHTFLDLGTAEFTIGQPHPLMSPEIKMERLITEMCQPDVDVIITDIVLGFGTVSNQAALLVQAVNRAAQETKGASRRIVIVTSVCGTEADNPSRSSQITLLQQAGIHVLGNNVDAAEWGIKLVLHRNRRNE